MDCNLSSSSNHGISQARMLEWVAISFSRESFQPRDQSQVSWIAGRFFTIWATREAQIKWSHCVVHTAFLHSFTLSPPSSLPQTLAPWREELCLSYSWDQHKLAFQSVFIKWMNDLQFRWLGWNRPKRKKSNSSSSGVWAPRSPKERAYGSLGFHTFLQGSPWLWLYTWSY